MNSAFICPRSGTRVLIVRQTARFLTDLDVFNEWMNEVDYEYDEEAAKGTSMLLSAHL